MSPEVIASLDAIKVNMNEAGMNTINIVFGNNLLDQRTQVSNSGGMRRLHIPSPLESSTLTGMFGRERLLAMSFYMGGIAQRNGDKPSMQLHTAFVALFNGKGQRVVTGSYTMPAGKHRAEWLDG